MQPIENWIHGAAHELAAKLRVSKVAYCCFSMGQILPFYGVKQLKVS
jgi:hypothetical protein